MLINLLQRYYLWFFVILFGLNGLALGHLAATSIGLLAEPTTTAGPRQSTVVQKVAANLSLDSYNDILSRDIFNSSGASQSLGRPKSALPAGKKPHKTASKWTLIGTVSGGQTPLATLSSGSTPETYALNEKLPDGAKLSSISRNRVELSYPDGRVQQLETVQSKQPASIKRKLHATRPQGSGQRVENLGQNRWQIPTRVAENARSNIGNLLSQAQAVPYLEGKQTTGFQIRMIRPGSLIAQLGLKKGDILREVNGVALNSPEKALQIFGQLRQAKQISISLERRGKAMTFAYEIR